MKLLDRISKNWKKHQAYLIILIFLFVFLLNIYLNSNTIQEGFEEQESYNVNFIQNFPRQDFKMIWSKKMDDDRYISFWRRDSFKDYYPIGDVAITTLDHPTTDNLERPLHDGLSILVKDKDSKKPLDYEKIWDNQHLKGESPLSIWKVIPDDGYVAMGDIVVNGYDKPSRDIIRCLPRRVVEESGKIGQYLWKYPTAKKDSKGNDIPSEMSLSIWSIESIGFFMARESYLRPDYRKGKIYKIIKKALETREISPDEEMKYLKVELSI